MLDEEVFAYRIDCWNIAKKNHYVGPVENIRSDYGHGESAEDLIQSIKDHVKKHNSISSASRLSTVVSCETSVSSEVLLRELCTLSSGTWISNIVIEFGLQEHALRTGACCFKFPTPLPDGPKIVFADTWFFHHHVEENHRWKLGTDWDWLIAPTFVDHSHSIVLAVSFSRKKILCFDSLGIPRLIYLNLLKRWVSFVTSNAYVSESGGWIIKQSECPQLQNGHDCGILHFGVSILVFTSL